MEHIQVIDGLLTEQDELDIEHFFATLDKWSYGQKSILTSFRQSLPHWTVYFLKDDLEKGTGVHNVTFDKACIQKLYELILPRIPRNSKLLRCYANAHTYGVDGRIHYDDHRENTTTCIFYPMKDWLVDWGGETIFWDKESREITKSVIPKSNRLLIFKSTMWHGVRPLSRYCESLRVTLMFKFLHPDE
jgi:SM-20-related protein